MHDIKELEDAWKKYHKKRFRPYYIVFVFLLLIAALGYYFLNVKNNYLHPVSTKIVQDEKPVVVSKKSTHSKLLLNGPIGSLQEKEVEELKPEVNMNHIKKTFNQEVEIPTLPIVDNIPVMDDTKDITKKVSKRVPIFKTPKKDIEKPHKRVHLNILKSSDKNAYKAVEKRFNQFQDPDDSLFLARIYYKNAAYEKAAQWALKTNKINANIEESWIIFAKSKVKMGKVNDAIHILQSYIRQSNSQEAKQLLFKIQK